MTRRRRWSVWPQRWAVSFALLSVAAVAFSVGSGGVETAVASSRATSRDEAQRAWASPELHAALAAWASFPVHARVRPLVLTGDVVSAPDNGFGTNHAKEAFLSGLFVGPAILPVGPGQAGGRPLIGSSEAWAMLQAEGTPGAGHPAPLTITDVSLGTASFATDRGAQVLPAWRFSFDGVANPASVLAVAPASRVTPPPLTTGRAFEGAQIAKDGRVITVSFVGQQRGRVRARPTTQWTTWRRGPQSLWSSVRLAKIRGPRAASPWDTNAVKRSGSGRRTAIECWWTRRRRVPSQSRDEGEGASRDVGRWRCDRDDGGGDDRRPFIASWRRGDVEDMLECCADDVRYQNMPMEPGVGTAALREVQDLFFSVAQNFRIEVHRQVSSGNLVMQERTDYFSIGESTITLPVCGVFEIESGRIAAWREYFDMATGMPT